MKLSVKKLRLDRITMVHTLHQVRDTFFELPTWFLIKNLHVLVLVITTSVFAIGFWLIVVLLYLEPPGFDIDNDSQLQLSVDAIDRLEFWIEVRQEERLKPLSRIRTDYFRSNIE